MRAAAAAAAAAARCLPVHRCSMHVNCDMLRSIMQHAPSWASLHRPPAARCRGGAAAQQPSSQPKCSPRHSRRLERVWASSSQEAEQAKGARSPPPPLPLPNVSPPSLPEASPFLHPEHPAVMQQVEASATLIDDMIQEVARDLFLDAAVTHVMGEHGRLFALQQTYIRLH